MLWLIGLGMADGDISQRALDAMRKADRLFAEFYTSTWTGDLGKLEELLKKHIEVLSRERVEQEDEILEQAREKRVAFLVPGDPLVATTHADILARARAAGIKVEVIHAPSIISAIGETGLHVYKFGPPVSLPQPQKDYHPSSPFEKIRANLRAGLHTLVILDTGMRAQQALEMLEKNGMEQSVVVAARLGTKDASIAYGKIKDLKKQDFGRPPHVIVVPGELHFTEKEFLESL